MLLLLVINVTVIVVIIVGGVGGSGLGIVCFEAILKEREMGRGCYIPPGLATPRGKPATVRVRSIKAMGRLKRSQEKQRGRRETVLWKTVSWLVHRKLDEEKYIRVIHFLKPQELR